MSVMPARADFSAVSERMGHLLLLRLAMGAIVLAWSAIAPSALGVPFTQVAGWTAAYLAVALGAEWARRRSGHAGYWILTGILLLDGLYLAAVMYATGGTESPIRFLVYLHLVAVSLLASYRTGLKIALWHSLLLFVVLYAQAARLLPPVDVRPGAAVAFDRIPVLNVTSFWLFALATSIFSALNERELRNRRADLQTLVDVGARLDAVADPIVQARVVLDGLVERFEFRRGVVLATVDDGVVALATVGTETPLTTAVLPDRLVRTAWERHEILPVRGLDRDLDPVLHHLMPDARRLLVAPLFADGQPAGAIVVEPPVRRLRGVERRVVAMLGQFAALAALNLRNAVLLRHVRDLAERDSLTGVANRRTFQTTLEGLLSSPLAPGRLDRVAAVLFIDVDDFKVVNDTLGHAAGDALLVAVTERLGHVVRQSDLVARLGGDEFAILTDDEPDLRRSQAIAERIVRELRAPYRLGDRDIVVSVSVGIASARDAADGAADLVRNADAAMYMAKANGKSGFAIFDPEMHRVIRERHELSAELQRAVEMDQLRLVYQPIVELSTGGLAGFEALVRWQHPERGLVMPGRFIAIAEETGAILPIGEWVLLEACREVAGWVRDGLAARDLFVGVNVSAREVQQVGFVESVRRALESSGLEPTRLLLEITETALLRATPATVATLEELRGLGIRTVIDDFGTGFFSLSHLRQFPVDVLKIASEFVQDGDPASKSSSLARAIVSLGDSLGLEVVAEGIETAEQAARMRELGCRYGQGYVFARPLAGAELLEELRAVPALPAVVEGDGSRAGRPGSAAPAPARGQSGLRRPSPATA